MFKIAALGTAFGVGYLGYVSRGVKKIKTPETSLLYRRANGATTDLFELPSPRSDVSLESFVTSFFTSPAFAPERTILRIAGKGDGTNPDRLVHAADGETFLLWTKLASTDSELLLTTNPNEGASDADETVIHTYFQVDGDRVRFGSSIAPDRGAVKSTRPLHEFYSKLLLFYATEGLAPA